MNTYTLTSDRILCGDGQLFDGAAAKGISFTLGGKQPQLLLLLFCKTVTISETENVNFLTILKKVTYMLCKDVQDFLYGKGG